MKILHVNSYYSTNDFYKNLYDRQIKRGLDVSVFVPVSNDYKGPSVSLGEYSAVRLNHGKFDRLFFHVKHSKIFKDILKQYGAFDFNVIHAHSLFSNGWIAYQLYKKYGIPYLVAVRDTDVHVFFDKMPLLRKTGVEILLHASGVVFLSSAYRKKIIENYIPEHLKNSILKKSVVIPNGMDDFWLDHKNTGERLIQKNNRVKILFAGQVSKRKNILTTIKACSFLINKGYQIEYTVVGRIVSKRVQRAIRKVGFVRYIGQQPKERLIEIYRDHDIFVMPSLTETFGLVYAEAMSQGLPVIYSKGQGFDTQFEEGTVGFHVHCRDYKDIARRIIDIQNDYKRISKNCVDRSGKFDWNEIERQYEDIYGSMHG